MNSLDLALLYLLAAVLGVALFRFIKLPAVLGYLLVGILIGPNALALAKDSASVRYLAEFGVVFLMFVIGLEFNLPKLMGMKRLVFGLGMGQVLFTIVGALAGHAFMGVLTQALGWSWDLSWQGAVALGAAMAMSSTAIVARLMAERLELESEHGKQVMGVLLFQDLAVVPLLVLIPALAETPGRDMWLSLSLGLGKGALLAMTVDMAYSHGREGVRVNAIAPGHITTPMVHSVQKPGAQAEFMDTMRSEAGLLGTPGTGWDVGWAACFLASDEARWITGALLPVESGVLSVTPLLMAPYLREVPAPQA